MHKLCQYQLHPYPYHVGCHGDGSPLRAHSCGFDRAKRDVAMNERNEDTYSLVLRPYSQLFNMLWRLGGLGVRLDTYMTVQPNIDGAFTFTHVCVDSSRTVLEHHRSFTHIIMYAA